MSARNDLQAAVFNAIANVQAGDMPPAIDGPRFVLTLPGLGRWVLIPHSPETPPGGGTLVYVGLEGAAETLQQAVWANGQWNGRNLKPLSRPVAVWYHMERERDGE